jgi:hypothetical protein
MTQPLPDLDVYAKELTKTQKLRPQRRHLPSPIELVGLPRLLADQSLIEDLSNPGGILHSWLEAVSGSKKTATRSSLRPQSSGVCRSKAY